LQRVCDAGLCAEAISGAEVQAAATAGFPSDRLVLGGVAKSWPTGTLPKGLLALLDDTLEAFDEGVHGPRRPRYHCLRLRYPDVGSRLGFDTADRDQRNQAVKHLLRAHEGGSAVGLATHEHTVSYSTAEHWLRAIQHLLDGLDEAHPRILTAIACLDLGGGFDATCLDEILCGDLGVVLLELIRSRLPNCEKIILEPGKSLVQAYGAVVSCVIAHISDREVCVDASMAELPWPMPGRPVYVWHRDDWEPVARGTGIVAGRTTAETDVLAVGVDVSGLHPGDRVLFAEAGAYDVSMRSGFGTGAITRI
jgi:diaminopimelate decarboxylase